MLSGRSALLSLRAALATRPAAGPAACGTGGAGGGGGGGAGAPQRQPGEPGCSGAVEAVEAAAIPDGHHYRRLPSREAAELSYDEFVRQYMAPNLPVVIRGATAGWRASSEWRTPEGGLRLDPLQQLAGRCRVCVTDTRNSQDDGCGDVRTVSLEDFLAWWRSRAAVQRPGGQPVAVAVPVPAGLSPAWEPGREAVPHPGPLQTSNQPPPAHTSPGQPLAAPELPQPAAKQAHGTATLPAGSAAGASDEASPAPAPGRECSGHDGAGAGPRGSAHEVGGAGLPAEPGPERPEDPAPATSDGSGPLAASGLWYLKDWHFVAEFPDYGAYRLPVYFADDWLNAFYDSRATERQLGATSAARAQQDPHAAPAAGSTGGASSPDAAGLCRADVAAEAAPPPSTSSASAPASAPTSTPAPAAFTSDYRFCYLGPAGTWTPLHSDVLRSHSWSANVCGRKRWLLLAPNHTHLLYDRRGLAMAPHLEPGRVGSGCEPGDFPGLHEARAHAFELVQEAGDAVFVPSGWHHCVENLEDTLSLNHNWLNGHNCHWTWALLRRQYVDAAEAIQDCRPLCPVDEFEDLVQSNLEANMGLSWLGWVGLLECAVKGALRNLEEHEASTSGLTGTAAEAKMTALLALERAGQVLCVKFSTPAGPNEFDNACWAKDPCGNATRPAAWNYSTPCPSPRGNATCEALPSPYTKCSDWVSVTNATQVACAPLECCASPQGRSFTASFCTPKNVTCMDYGPNGYACMPQQACPADRAELT
ncbi:hypothetical protein GPECTOR_1g788 [Gonium pectorale]|uniref:JmjC domain-containing protein n=1 Tax=Gonium pectorale TaxID=33097 RepID=A0A150H490_GONPE|nr:hypothetical protein GPECTOR_1g788 [Gonium pectorale]|eukprot:KXZ56873.1 hypothetical protein GPECTOR_1g788 [Gonium pectorale]